MKKIYYTPKSQKREIQYAGGYMAEAPRELREIEDPQTSVFTECQGGITR